MIRKTTVTMWVAAELGAIAAFSLGVLTGCGTHTSAPDPAPGNVVQGTNAHVIQEPYGFRNVAFSCFGTNGVYVTSRGVSGDDLPSAVFVLAGDPQCRS